MGLRINTQFFLFLFLLRWSLGPFRQSAGLNLMPNVSVAEAAGGQITTSEQHDEFHRPVNTIKASCFECMFIRVWHVLFFNWSLTFVGYFEYAISSNMHQQPCARTATEGRWDLLHYCCYYIRNKRLLLELILVKKEVKTHMDGVTLHFFPSSLCLFNAKLSSMSNKCFCLM